MDLVLVLQRLVDLKLWLLYFGKILSQALLTDTPFFVLISQSSIFSMYHLLLPVPFPHPSLTRSRPSLPTLTFPVLLHTQLQTSFFRPSWLTASLRVNSRLLRIFSALVIRTRHLWELGQFCCRNRRCKNGPGSQKQGKYPGEMLLRQPGWEWELMIVGDVCSAPHSQYYPG